MYQDFNTPQERESIDMDFIGAGKLKKK